MAAHAESGGSSEMDEVIKVGKVFLMAAVLSLIVLLAPQALMLIPFAPAHALAATWAAVATPEFAAGLFWLSAGVIGIWRHG